MDGNPDVIHELFGDSLLMEVTIGLEREISNILWSLKAALGEVAYLRIRNDPRAAEALVHILYDRRRDETLVGTFRDYVLASEGLYYLLTAEAKSEANKRRQSAITPASSTGPAAHMAHHTSVAELGQNTAWGRNVGATPEIGIEPTRLS